MHRTSLPTPLRHFRRPPLHHPPTPLLLLLPLLSLLLLVSVRVAECTVTTLGTPDNDSDAARRRQYRSRPAGFGMEFEYGAQYAARLQVIEGDAHLCGGGGSSNDAVNDGGTRDEEEGEEDYNRGNETTIDDEIHVVKPADGLPGASHCRVRRARRSI